MEFLSAPEQKLQRNFTGIQKIFDLTKKKSMVGFLTSSVYNQRAEICAIFTTHGSKWYEVK